MKDPSVYKATEKRGLKHKTVHAVKKLSVRGKTGRTLQRHVMVETAIFLVVAILFIVFIRRDFYERPGILEDSDLKALERTTSSITIGWSETRNTKEYQLYYKPTDVKNAGWDRVTIENGERRPATSFKIGDLKEGTRYCFVMRADSDEREGFKSDAVYYSTKKSQTIRIPRRDLTKLTTSGQFSLGATASTKLTYKSSDEKVVTVGTTGRVSVKGEGTATIKITADEDRNYTGATDKVRILVLDDADEKASSADTKIICTLDEDNCDALFSVHTGGTPQSFAFTGDKYIVAYNGGYNGLVTYSDKGERLSSSPTSCLGHANGFTYCNETGLCYGMRGNSHRMDSYDPETGDFGTTSSGYGGAGIAYDRIGKVIYLSSRAGVRVLSADGKFRHKDMISSISHSGRIYTQDCGGHAGIVFRCISGSNKHGTNYVDLYRVSNGKYIGSLFTSIGEVESAVADNDGYLVLLINSAGDYIWKTPINIETLAE